MNIAVCWQIRRKIVILLKHNNRPAFVINSLMTLLLMIKPKFKSERFKKRLLNRQKVRIKGNGTKTTLRK